jgi:hypothetical protein
MFEGRDFKIMEIAISRKDVKNSLSSPQFVIEPTSNLIIPVEEILFYLERAIQCKSLTFKSEEKPSLYPTKNWMISIVKNKFLMNCILGSTFHNWAW